jgi:hypothetical protein
MLVLEHMFVFEIAALIAGLMTGAFAAMLPDYRGTERPIRHIVALGLSIGALYGLLPVVVLSAHFVPVLIATVFSVGVGFVAASTHQKEQAMARSSDRELTPKSRSLAAQAAPANVHNVNSKIA